MKPHRWTLVVLGDGSGVALVEWRGEYECREHVPLRAKPGPWGRDECRVPYAGIRKRGDEEIPRPLARDLLAAWRAVRRAGVGGGWLDL